jgi:hypothetical protein
VKRTGNCAVHSSSRPKVSPAVTQLHPDADAIFKDSYLVDFLGLPEAHSEQELQTAIIVNLKRFLLELGRDFAFVGEQYLLPVGGHTFAGLKGVESVNDIAARFLEIADPKSPDAGCVADIRRQPFVVKSDGCR